MDFNKNCLIIMRISSNDKLNHDEVEVAFSILDANNDVDDPKVELKLCESDLIKNNLYNRMD